MTTTADPMTATAIPVNVLRDALTAALVAVGTESYLPMLNAVQIEKNGNTLIFRATDRYRLVRVTVQLESAPEDDWVVMLPAANVKQIVAALPKKGLYAATLGPVDVRFTVTVEDGASLQFTPYDGYYPKSDGLIPTTFEPTESIGFTPKYLADVVKLPGRNVKDPLVFRFNGPLKPAMTQWSNGVSEYLYLLMPVRIGEPE